MRDLDLTTWGDRGPVLHLAHANGLPCGVYGAFAERLAAHYRVVATPLRPLWPESAPDDLRSWVPLAEDLIAGLRAQGHEGIIGVGHSLGSVVSLLAANRDPTLFRGLVLIDPVLFSGLRAFLWRWARRLGQIDHVPIVAGALKRRDRWPSREAARRWWESKPFFREWEPRCFEDYLTHGLVDDGLGGVRLRYPKAWEAAIFRSAPGDPWREVRRVPVPTLVLRGATSHTLLTGAARRLAHDLPRGRVVEVPGTGHLLPIERPDEVARLVLNFADTLPTPEGGTGLD